MEHGHGRNDVQTTIGRFKLDLPTILPAFERTEPRTFHHWRDALEHRRLVRKAKRAHLKHMVQTGSDMLSDLLDDHHKRRIER